MPIPENTNPDPLTGTAETVQLERLEFGKLCVTPDGPVAEGANASGQLGWSSEFPVELLPFCMPSAVGVRSHELEGLPRECRHGTVLRPARMQGRVQPILGRIGKRHEAGPNSPLYTLARYLAIPAGNQVEPWDAFQAMEPLRGITESEATALPPVIAGRTTGSLRERLESPETRLQTRRFVQEALIYVMSGIPVSITERIDEEQFFALVTALWRLMPPELRPSLSAGWGVAASLAGALAVIYTEWPPAGASAVFSRSGDGKWRWQPPGEVFDREGRASLSFTQEHVSPGAHYVWRRFGCEPYKLPRFEALEAAFQSGLPAQDAQPAAVVPGAGLLKLHDPAVAFLFQAPGLEARDQYLYEQWERHLGPQADGGAEDLADLSTDFAFEKHKRLAFELLRAVLSDGGRRTQAETLFWRLLGSGDHELFASAVDGDRDASATRLRLFVALRYGGALEALEAIYQCAESGEAHPLPQAAHEMLDQRLRINLYNIAPACARIHISLLNLEEPPPDYLDWVKQHGFELALGLMGSGVEYADAFYRRLAGRTGSPGVRGILGWIENSAPTPNDEETIRGLSPIMRYRFFGQLMERWNLDVEDRAAHRERLLPWLRLTRTEGQPVNDPLLALAFEEGPGIEDSLRIVEAIEKQAVPPSLLPGVAQFALDQYARLSEFIDRNVPAWSAVLRLWPRDILSALWLTDRLNWVDRAPAGGAREGAIRADRFRIGAEQLETLIVFWSKSPDSDPAVSRLYWTWIKNALHSAPQSSTPTIRICDSLLRSQPLPRAWNSEDVERARKLAEAAGETPGLSRIVEERWRWESDPKAMLLLLDFFPRTDFQPSPLQLGALVYHREEVKRHLKTQGLIPSRPRRFGILTLPPLSADYPGSGELVWHDDFADHPFWIVFKGAPMNKQREGSLRSALRFYCNDGGTEFGASRKGSERIRSQEVEICREYMLGYSGRSRGMAIEKVLREFVIRWLYYHERRNIEEIRLLLLGPGDSGSDPFWSLAALIRSLSKDRVISNAIDDIFQDLRRENAQRQARPLS